MGAPTQQLAVDEVAQKGTVGPAGLAYKASGNNYFLDITKSYII
jgi:hypothetical protein